MKIAAILLTCFSLSIFTSVADDKIDYAKVEPAKISKAIDLLTDDPFSKDADGYSALIVNFAQASPDIIVSLDTSLLPWLTDDKLPESALRLTSAYVAGNVAAQLKLGKAQDSPEAGVAAAIEMYRKLRAAEKIPKIPVMERWKGMKPIEIVTEAEVNKEKKANKSEVATPR